MRPVAYTATVKCRDVDYNSEQSVIQDIPFEKLSDSQDNPLQMQQGGKLARGCRAVAEYLILQPILVFQHLLGFDKEKAVAASVYVTNILQECPFQGRQRQAVSNNTTSQTDSNLFHFEQIIIMKTVTTAEYHQNRRLNG